MIRTQIYLTEDEREGLEKASKVTGKKQSELIREAVDKYLSLVENKRRELVLDRAAGLWQHRLDIPDFSSTRNSWDRG